MAPQPPTRPAPSCDCAAATRRGFLGTQLGLGAGALAALAAPPAAAAPSPPPTAAPHTPEDAIAALMEGNKRFAAARLGVCAQPLADIRHQTETKQTPFAAVLSCADSRVPVELVFDQGIGQVFVTRVAGNIATPDMIASLEYGVAVLGVQAIVVLGHGDCGAVKAAVARTAAPGQISSLYAFLRPAVDRANGDVAAAIRINAGLQARLLAGASPVLAAAVAAGKLAIIAGYYDVGSGKVSLLTA
jgi:carbonic anhydrase